ncbi:hypothetical protein ACJX0J_010060, partial [Zea mays]
MPMLASCALMTNSILWISSQASTLSFFRSYLFIRIIPIFLSFLFHNVHYFSVIPIFGICLWEIYLFMGNLFPLLRSTLPVTELYFLSILESFCLEDFISFDWIWMRWTLLIFLFLLENMSLGLTFHH